MHSSVGPFLADLPLGDGKMRRGDKRRPYTIGVRLFIRKMCLNYMDTA